MDSLQVNKMYYIGCGRGLMIIKKTEKFITIRDYIVNYDEQLDKFICKDKNFEKRCKLYINNFNELFIKVQGWPRFFKSNDYGVTSLGYSCYELLDHDKLIFIT